MSDPLGTIGNFSGATTVPPVEDEETKEVQDTAAPEPGTEERYWYDLEKAGISRQEALDIMDAVLEKGYYEEPWRLSTRVHGTFVTRTYADAMRLQDVIEARQITFQSTYNEVITRYNLAASLGLYKSPTVERRFKHKTEEDFLDNEQYVQNLPMPVVVKLGSKLAEFDQKIALVFAEGAPENF